MRKKSPKIERSRELGKRGKSVTRPECEAFLRRIAAGEVAEEAAERVGRAADTFRKRRHRDSQFRRAWEDALLASEVRRQNFFRLVEETVRIDAAAVEAGVSYRWVLRQHGDEEFMARLREAQGAALGRVAKGMLTAAEEGNVQAAADRWLEHRRVRGISAAAPLFCSLRGRPLDSSHVRRLLARLGRRAGLERRVHAHAFRHAAANELAYSGTPLVAVQQFLGHKYASTTQAYLRRLTSAELEAAVAARPLPSWAA